MKDGKGQREEGEVPEKKMMNEEGKVKKRRKRRTKVRKGKANEIKRGKNGRAKGSRSDFVRYAEGRSTREGALSLV